MPLCFDIVDWASGRASILYVCYHYNL